MGHTHVIDTPHFVYYLSCPENSTEKRNVLSKRNLCQVFLHHNFNHRITFNDVIVSVGVLCRSIKCKTLQIHMSPLLYNEYWYVILINLLFCLLHMNIYSKWEQVEKHKTIDNILWQIIESFDCNSRVFYCLQILIIQYCRVIYNQVLNYQEWCNLLCVNEQNIANICLWKAPSQINCSTMQNK